MKERSLNFEDNRDPCRVRRSRKMMTMGSNLLIAECRPWCFYVNMKDSQLDRLSCVD